MRVHTFSKSDYHTTHERLAYYRVIDALKAFSNNDEDVYLFANVQLGDIEVQQRDGSTRQMRGCEPDLIVIKNSAVIVVEMKDWHGNIEWPVTKEEMGLPWYEHLETERRFLCEGNRSPLSQVWYNRRVLVAHLERIKQGLPTEAARTSRFDDTCSALLFTNDRIRFITSKPDFWRATDLCTLTGSDGSRAFSEVVAATTTRRRHHRDDPRHAIELSESDIDFLRGEWGVSVGRGETIEVETQSVEEAYSPTFAVSRLPQAKKVRVEQIEPDPEVASLPTPLRLLKFYKTNLLHSVRSEADINLSAGQYRKFHHLQGITLEQLLSKTGITVMANDLPSWSPNPDLVVGVFMIDTTSKGASPSARPAFTFSATMKAGEPVDNRPTRVITISDSSYAEINSYALRMLARFERDEEFEFAERIEQLERCPDAAAQIEYFFSEVLGETMPSILGPLPQERRTASFSAIVYEASPSYTRNLIDDLTDMEKEWELTVRAGKIPTDLAWEMLSEGRIHAVRPEWTPRKVSLLPLNFEQSIAASMIYDGNARVGIVSGPPGTGKSQLICNVLAEASERGNTVLFASNNNKAVDVVVEKLNHKLLELPIVISYGNSSRTETTVKQLREVMQRKTVSEAHLEHQVRESRKEISVINGELHELHQNFMKYRELRLEEDYLISTIDAEIPNCPQARELAVKDLDALKDFSTALECWQAAIEQHRRLLPSASSLVKRLSASIEGVVGVSAVFLRKRFLADLDSHYTKVMHDGMKLEHYRFLEPLAFADQRADLCQSLQLICNSYRRLRQIETELAGQSERWFLDQWAKIEAKRIEPSRALLSASSSRILSTYARQWSERLEARGTLPAGYVAKMNTLATTSLSVRGKVDLKTRFDIVIIDEASQSTIQSVLPLLYRATRCIVIGDERQLQPINATEDVTYYSNMRRFNLYCDEMGPWVSKTSSILSLAQHKLDDGGSYVMLRDHHRCHPDIIEFSNREFYDRMLRIQTRPLDTERKQGVMWYEVDGVFNEKSNLLEGEKIANVVRRLLEQGFVHEEIGVVTPFRNQKHLIQNLLKQKGLLDGNNGTIQVDTAHGFQGGERDAMVYSLVVTADTNHGTRNWANAAPGAANLINVAITRAKQFLIVVGSSAGTSGYTQRLREWCTKAEDVVTYE